MGQSESKLKSRVIECVQSEYGVVKFRKIIKKMKKLDINSITDSTGSTLINLASQMGKKSIMLELIKMGANTNIPNNFGMTPIHHSVLNGEEEATSLLLRAGANPNVVTELQLTPLITAIKRGDEKLVEILFSFYDHGNNSNNNNNNNNNNGRSEKDSNIPTTLGGSGASSSSSSSSSSSLSNSSILNINNGNIIPIDINFCDKQKMTPLMWASNEGNQILVKYLLNMGADVNKRDGTGKTAIFFAKQNSHCNIVAMLNERFCKVNKITNAKPSHLNNNNNNNNGAGNGGGSNSTNNINNINNNNNQGSSNMFNSHIPTAQPLVSPPQFNTATDSLASSWSSSDSGLNQLNNNNNNNNNSINNINNNVSLKQSTSEYLDSSSSNNNNNSINNVNINNNKIDNREQLHNQTLATHKNGLKRDHSTLHSTISSSSDKGSCRICWERPSDTVLLWCGHVGICYYDSQFVTVCPICVEPIEKVQRIFFS